MLVSFALHLGPEASTVPGSSLIGENVSTSTPRASSSPMTGTSALLQKKNSPPVERKFSPPPHNVVASKAPLLSTHGPFIGTSTPTSSSDSQMLATSSSASVHPSEGMPSSIGLLNERDIIALTNNERAAFGLPPLSFNVSLETMSEFKSEDMIAKQYFAHVAPDGTDVAKLAGMANYEYLNLGENLAMGDFVSSKDVVEGWMNSPGHRANILSKNFTEIGVSAIKGIHEGREVWYAVQEFGRPASDCSKPDVVLQEKISTENGQADMLTTELSALRASIDSGTLDQETYQSKVAEYNLKVATYNALVVQLKSDVDTYNALVHVYNSCIQS